MQTRKFVSRDDLALLAVKTNFQTDPLTKGKKVPFYNNPCFTLKHFRLFFQSELVVEQEYLAQHSIDFTASLFQTFSEIGPKWFKLQTM